ncbi:MAG: DUF2339 domain-containing protein [Leptospirales bacterium]
MDGKNIIKLEKRIESIEKELLQVKSDLHKIKPGVAKADLQGTESRSEAKVSLAVKAGNLFSTTENRNNLFHKVEIFFGTNLIGKLGFLAIILSFAWFIKLAIDKQWLNESARVYIGLISGFSVLITGFLFSKKINSALSQLSLGTGFAILYLSIFGSYYYYSLLGSQETFLYLFFLIAISSAISLIVSGEVLYIISLIGALATPALLSTGENSYRLLFAYITIINIFFLYISVYRPWRIAPFFVLAGNFLVFFAWGYTNIGESAFVIPFLFVTSVTGIFLIRQIFLHPMKARSYKVDNVVLSGLSVALYYSANTFLFYYFHTDVFYLFLMGFALSVSLFQYAHQKNVFKINNLPDTTVVYRTLLIIAWLSLGLAAIFNFYNGPWILALSISIVGITLIGTVKIGVKGFPHAILPVLIVIILPILIFNYNIYPDSHMVLWNSRAALMCLMLLYLSVAFYLEHKKEKRKKFLYISLATAWTIVLLFSFFTEVSDLFSDRLYRNFGYSVVMVVASAVFFGIAFMKEKRELRIAGLVLAIIVIGKLYLYDVWILSKVIRIVSFFLLGGAMILLSLFYHKYKERLSGEKETT